MSEHKLKAGTKMYWGTPAKPMPEIMADAILQVVAQVPGIHEAHLPQCFIEGDKEARQVLAISVQSRNEIPRIAKELKGKLQLVFPLGQIIEILLFETGSMPSGVRQAGCQIFTGEKKP